MEVLINTVPDVLYVSLNNQKLKSSFVLTNRDSLFQHIDEGIPYEESFPYAFFLNQYLDCEMVNLDIIVNDIYEDIDNGKTEIASQNILVALDELSYKTDNRYLVHCIAVVRQKYVTVCSKSYAEVSSETKKANIKIYYDSLKVRAFPLLDIFSAYDLMPYHKVDSQKRKQILEDPDWGTRDWQISNQLYFDITQMIKYYITLMINGKLFLQICENNECNKLFVTTSRRKAKFCKGAYCELDGENCADKASRHKNKVARCEYLKVYEKTLNYFNQRVIRGNYSVESRDSFKQKAKEQKKQVESKTLTEKEFIDWLNEERQKAIVELKESKEI